MPARKVLLDECVDIGLAEELVDHDVQTVVKTGWAGLKNGELLQRAQASFDVFITTDRNLQYQQNLSGFDIAVILLAAQTNRLTDLLPLVPQLLDAIPDAEPGQLTVLQS